MIAGYVNEKYQVVIPILLPDLPTRDVHRFSAVVDTGLDHYLALPRADVQQLGLPIISEQTLVTGSEEDRRFPVCGGLILWDGQPIPIRILVSEQLTLVGNRLLAGCYLTAVMVPGGRVTISRLPTPEP